MNPEIDKKFLEIRRKCNNKGKNHYPGYCHRAVLDLLSLLNLIREEQAETENKVENLVFVNDYQTIQEATS